MRHRWPRPASWSAGARRHRCPDASAQTRREPTSGATGPTSGQDSSAPTDSPSTLELRPTPRRPPAPGSPRPDDSARSRAGSTRRLPAPAARGRPGRVRLLPGAGQGDHRGHARHRATDHTARRRWTPARGWLRRRRHLRRAPSRAGRPEIVAQDSNLQWSKRVPAAGATLDAGARRTTSSSACRSTRHPVTRGRTASCSATTTRAAPTRTPGSPTRRSRWSADARSVSRGPRPPARGRRRPARRAPRGR